MENEKSIAVVVLSGGQDSVTCLGYACNQFDEVHAISFKYGQKHSVELGQAAIACAALGVLHVVHEIPSLSVLADSALTSNGDVGKAHPRHANLPASFVPNRNALFLTIAHAYAQKVGSNVVITGVCQTDYSGYPDCRNEFIQSLQHTLNTGYQTSIQIETPMMWLTKAETFAFAEKHNVLDLVLEVSHTCYNGKRDKRFEWGYGCGECPACKIRAKGFEEFKEGVK